MRFVSPELAELVKFFCFCSKDGLSEISQVAGSDPLKSAIFNFY